MANYRGRIGFGDGSRTSFNTPITGYTLLKVYVNGSEVFDVIDYNILPAASEYDMDIIVFVAAPASEYPIEIEWTDHTAYVHTVESLRISMGVGG